LIQAKQNHGCYAQFIHHTKLKALGGLAFINAPDADGHLQPILDKQAMEDMLLEFSRTHFAKAEGTRSTSEPLSQILVYDGLIPYGINVMQGRPNFE